MPRFLITGICLFVLICSGISAAGSAQEGDGLIGTRAPEWIATTWIHSEPMGVAQLKGKVVLVRWWTAPACPYCAASAPYLNEWHERYQDRGLAVVGMYHPKPPGAIGAYRVEKFADTLGMTFPLAIDPDWEMLGRWWLNGNKRRWTSVSFLIDRDGLIQYVHPGGAYSPDEAKEMEEVIKRLLKGPVLET